MQGYSPKAVVPFVSGCMYSIRSEKKTSTQEWPNKIMPLSNKWMNKNQQNNTQHMSLVATSHLKPQPFSNVLSGTSTQDTFCPQIIDIFLGKKLHPRDQSSLSHEFAHGICVLETLPEWATPQIFTGPVCSMEHSTCGEAVYLVSWTQLDHDSICALYCNVAILQTRNVYLCWCTLFSCWQCQGGACSTKADKYHLANFHFDNFQWWQFPCWQLLSQQH